TLPNGTTTGTLIVTIGAASSGVSANATSSAVPISVNLVTPVSPGSKASASANSLIIPSVGHLDGVNSQWRSDIRVTNTATFGGKVQLIFTPSDASQSAKSTTITVAAGDTVALDDIVRNWYGVGALGDAASGALEIRPLDQTKDTVRGRPAPSTSPRPPSPPPPSPPAAPTTPLPTARSGNSSPPFRSPNSSPSP